MAGSVVALVALVVVASACQYDWLQFGGGASHSGANAAETTLTLGNVASLHRVWQATLPAVADGAPAFVHGVATSSGTKDLVFVTTRAGGILALDAAGGALVWSKAFGPGTCKINNGATTCYTTSSPAVDPGLGWVYSYGLDGKVHKLAVADGSEVTTGGWPEVITVKGFDEKGSSALSTAKARSGATYLYMVTSGYPGDAGDYQGHVVTIDLATGAQHVFNTLCSNQSVHFVERPAAPDCAEVQSGVWARAGTMYDPDNDRLFISSGNGTFDPANHHWGDTVLALHPDGTPADAAGTPVDAYTPTNYLQLDTSDQDLGSTLPAILPTIPGSRVAHLGVMGGKDAKLRLIDLDNMSGHGPGVTGGEIGTVINVPQGGQTLTQPAVWVNPTDKTTWVFVANNSGTSALTLTVDGAGTPALSPRWTTSVPGTSPLVADGVLYEASGTTIGAYNPTTGANVWKDTTLGGLHWQSPVVADGTLLIEDGAGHVNAYQH